MFSKCFKHLLRLDRFPCRLYFVAEDLRTGGRGLILFFSLNRISLSVISVMVCQFSCGAWFFFLLLLLLLLLLLFFAFGLFVCLCLFY